MITLQYQSFWSSHHKLYQSIIVPWCSGMEKATLGEARLVCSPINGIVRGEAAAQVIRCGSLDAGGVMLQTADHLFPLAQLISLPFLVRNAEEASVMAVAMLDEFEELREEFDNSIKLLTYMGSDQFAFASTCGPIKTPADLAGKRVLVWDYGQMEEIRAWGGANPCRPESRKPFMDCNGTSGRLPTFLFLPSSRKNCLKWPVP